MDKCVIDNFFATDIANDLYENINSLKLKDTIVNL